MNFKRKLMLIMTVAFLSTVAAALIEEVFHTKVAFTASFNILLICTMAGAATILWEQYKLFRTPQTLKKIMMGLGALLFASIGAAALVAALFDVTYTLPMVCSALTLAVSMLMIMSKTKQAGEETATPTTNA